VRGANEGQTVQARQADVAQQDVELVGGKESLGLAAVVPLGHYMPDTFERLGKGFAQLGLIIDE
jgi:hypothetical protein